MYCSSSTTAETAAAAAAAIVVVDPTRRCHISEYPIFIYVYCLSALLKVGIKATKSHPQLIAEADNKQQYRLNDTKSEEALIPLIHSYIYIYI